MERQLDESGDVVKEVEYQYATELFRTPNCEASGMITRHTSTTCPPLNPNPNIRVYPSISGHEGFNATVRHELEQTRTAIDGVETIVYHEYYNDDYRLPKSRRTAGAEGVQETTRYFVLLRRSGPGRRTAGAVHKPIDCEARGTSGVRQWWRSIGFREFRPYRIRCV